MGRPPARELPPPTIRTTDGWHCLHAYFQVQPGRHEIDRDRLLAALDPEREHAPQRLQTFAVTGHRADLGVMAMDPDPLRLDAVLQEVRAAAGHALRPGYSFVSISEVSEYVPSVEQFAERLKREGMGEDDPGYRARVAGYEKRLPAMNVQRLTPEIPDLPVHCFYPMNKIREPGANWYTLPFSRRSELMAEHATSGIKFAGRGLAAHHRQHGLRRLGVGRDPVGAIAGGRQGDRLHDAVRRCERQLRRVRTVLRRLRHAGGGMPETPAALTAAAATATGPESR